KCFDHTTRAAEQAAEALAFDRAARLNQLALDLKPDGGAIGRAVLATRLGDALANGGRGAQAARAYLDAASLRTGAEALDLRLRAAEQLLRSGHVDRALATFKTVLAAIGMEVPSTQKSALASLMFRRAQARLRGLSFKERDLDQIASEDLTRVDACWAVGTG